MSEIKISRIVNPWFPFPEPGGPITITHYDILFIDSKEGFDIRASGFDQKAESIEIKIHPDRLYEFIAREKLQKRGTIRQTETGTEIEL